MQAHLLDGVFDMKVGNGDIVKMYRLGRWEEDKIRPLLVSFKSCEQKNYIMENLKNLEFEDAHREIQRDQHLS